MVVTDIKKTLTSIERFNIYIDSQYAFTLTLDSIAQFSIKKGLNLDHEAYENLVEIAQQEKFLPKFYNWLLIRQRYRQEAVQYLIRKNIRTELISSYISKFERAGLIDDNKFAEAYAFQARRKGKSNHYIKQYLESKGVQRQAIDSLSNDKDDNYTSLMIQVAKLRKRKLYQDDHKLFRYLVTHGYNYDEAKAALQFDYDAI